MPRFVAHSFINDNKKRHAMYQTDSSKFFILGIRKETQTSIIFDAEHNEKETLHLLEIDKEVISNYLDGKTPQDGKPWISENNGFCDCLEDAAIWIKNHDKDSVFVRDCAPNAYRLFKSNGVDSVCMSFIGNIADFMAKNACYTKFETYFSL